MALSKQECQECQENEKVALEAIYGDDVKIASNVWGVWKPLEAVVSLRPLETASKDEEHAFVTVQMRVVCTANYPNDIPTFTLEKERGISKLDLEALQKQLQDTAEGLRGSSMIMELCEAVRVFLFEHNKPPKGSFHDGMMLKNALDESERNRQRLTSEQREWNQVVEERERRKQDAEWKREEMRERQRTDSIADRDVCQIGPYAVVVVDPRPPGHKRKQHSCCSEWTGIFQGQTVIISEWVFEHTRGRKEQKRNMPNFSSFLKLLSAFRTSFASLPEFSDVDASVVPYAFIHVDQIANKDTHFLTRVYLAQFIATVDTNMQNIISKVSEDAGAVRRLATSCVCALRWLHEQKLAHGSIGTASLWTDDRTAFRLGDWQLGRSLNILADHFRAIVEGSSRGEAIVDVDDKTLRKKDLFVLGTLMDTIRHSSSDTSDVSCLLQSFIRSCQSVKSVDELVDHAYLAADTLLLLSDQSGSCGLRAVTGANTRLGRDFFIMKSLGKGGFGEVLLARNKLDLIHYAVKVIPLDPKSERLNRKMTREAKLFAKLNHPNVVRYYNAWIDNAPHLRTEVGAKERRKEISKAFAEDSLMPSRLKNLGVTVERDGQVESSDWSADWTKSHRPLPESASSEEDTGKSTNGAPPVQTLFSPGAVDDEFEILFEGSDDGCEEENSVISSEESALHSSGSIVQYPSCASEPSTTVPNDATVETMETSSTPPPPARLMHIQMEYCAKGTLRNLIDDGSLVGNALLAWQLFGEILAGLDYIHGQGMIHRDIKPMNILLDADSHVKIGDFGLATRELLFRRDPFLQNETEDQAAGDAGHTMQIGTEIYMAPELLHAAAHSYSAKIDVYSTGIVLFEMFYRPLPPGMERISTIQKLKEEGKVPEDFTSALPNMQGSTARRLIEEMLSSDPAERPSVRALVSEGRVPVADLDDDRFQKVFLQTVRRRCGRLFDWMMDRLVNEPTAAALANHYDFNPCKTINEMLDRERTMWQLWTDIEGILRVRAFVPMNAHTLCPAREVSQLASPARRPFLVVEPTAIPLALPFDLRTNFVRVVARNGERTLKRFALGKVFTPSRDGVGGVHPLERWELSIDSVVPTSPSASFEMQIQVISAALEIVCKALPDSQIMLRIGHMQFLDAVFRQMNVGGDTRGRLLDHLHDISTRVGHTPLSDRIESLAEICGSKTASALLAHLPDSKPKKFREECRTVIRSRDDVVKEMARSAVAEMERLAEAFADLTINIEFCGSLVYRPRSFKDGIVFQIRVPVPGRKSTTTVSLSAGGCYDSLLSSSVRHPEDPPSRPLSLFGCSLSMDGLVQIVLRVRPAPAPFSVLVCSYGRQLSAEKISLARALWRHHISTDMLGEPIESTDGIIEYCESKRIQHLLILFDANSILVRSMGIDHGKVDEEKAVDIVSAAQTAHAAPPPPQPALTPSRSSSSLTPQPASHSAFSNVSFSWAFVEKPAYPTRKKTEGHCQNILSDVVSKIGNRTRVEIVLTELSSDVLAAVSSRLDISSSQAQLTNAFDKLTKQYGKAKEELECLYSCLLGLLCPRNGAPPGVLVLFSTQDSYYRVLM